MKEHDYSAYDYMKAFRSLKLTSLQKRMLQVNYHAPNHTLTARQMSRALGYKGYGASNLHYGRLGRLIGEIINFPEHNICALVTMQKPKGSEWQWTMLPQVAKAIERLGLTSEASSSIPEEVVELTPLYEGAVRTVSVNAYERNAAAREKCILHYGCCCAICGMNLAEKYGDVAQGLIHVHHVRMISKVNAKYQIDPEKDLRPVCPNCHAVIHSKTPPYTIKEIARMLIKHR